MATTSFPRRSEIPAPRPPAPFDGAGRRPPRPASRAVLRGAIEHVALSTVLVMIEMERRSGVLHLARRRERALLVLREGQVLRAFVAGGAGRGGERTGLDAVFHLLAWTQGEFELEAGEVDGDDEIGRPTSFLLMEAARRLDEQNAAVGR